MTAMTVVAAWWSVAALPSEAHTLRPAGAAPPVSSGTPIPSAVGAAGRATQPVPPPSAVSTPAQPAPRHHDWGAYVPGFPGSAAALTAVERTAGRHLDVVMWYVHWGGPWNAFNAADLHTVIARGSTPLITWMSDDPSATAQGAYSAQAILSGRYDAYIRAWATGLHNAGGPVLLRFDHEMNGTWYPWSAGVGGQTAAGYVAVWRHVHDIFTAAGATNVRWVWSPNVAFTGSAPLAALYPGDAYVDRVGVDGYNWGTSDAAHTWQTFAGVFDTTLAQVTALTSRPKMITEVASTEMGGNKAAWITDFFATLAHRSDITGFVWFDADKETDWRLDSSPAARSAFVAGLRTLS